MPEQNGSSRADVMELWRNWLTETERQWNTFFKEVLGTEGASRIAGNYMDAYSVIQRALNQGMERYLNTFNLPTHSDIIELGERLATIEERLSNMENNLATLAQASGVSTTASVTQLRPARTRKPRGGNSSN